MTDAQGNSYGPYDIEVAGSEAEPFTEDAYYDLFGDVTGVVSGGALTFTGLTATLAPIVVRARGSRLARTDPWSLASLPTTGSSPRRDMLVARRQRTSGEGVSAVPGKTFLTLLQGTPAATPADPTPDPDDDEPLWSWQVPGGGGTVITGVRDLRRPAVVMPQVVQSGQGVASGTSPTGDKPMTIQAFSRVVTTNVNGDITTSFPRAFASGVASVVLTSGDVAAGGLAFAALNSVALGSFAARCFQAGGSVCANVNVRLSVIAIGW